MAEDGVFSFLPVLFVARTLPPSFQLRQAPQRQPPAAMPPPYVKQAFAGSRLSSFTPAMTCSLLHQSLLTPCRLCAIAYRHVAAAIGLQSRATVHSYVAVYASGERVADKRQLRHAEAECCVESCARGALLAYRLLRYADTLRGEMPLFYDISRIIYACRSLGVFLLRVVDIAVTVAAHDTPRSSRYSAMTYLKV